MAKIKKRTALIQIKIEPEVKNRILKFAFENNMTITEVMENGFYALLEHNEALIEKMMVKDFDDMHGM